MKPYEFIEMLKEDAIKLEKETGIPAAVKIAQAALETGWGKHQIKDRHSQEPSYNLFGIKHHGSNHPYVVCYTHEYIKGKKTMVEARFRKYESFYESLLDHSRFLLRNPRYKPAFQHKNDPVQFARELQKAGYATDPNYADKLISIMQKYNLLNLAG